MMTNTCKPVVAAVLFAFLATAAVAADLPKRKSGLWEMKMQMEAMPVPMMMQMCIDQNTDNIAQENAKGQKPDCSAMDTNRSGKKTTVHSVCKHEGMTVTTDMVITGDFESDYKAAIQMKYSPPVNGMSGTHMTQEAKWLGACKPGQKPGDVMVQGMPTTNMQNPTKNRPGAR